MKIQTKILTLLFLINNLFCVAQSDSSLLQLNKKRLGYTVAIETGLYASTMTALYFAWYKDYDQSALHWFDDRKEWLQVDKIGHGFSGYYIADALSSGYRWSGIKRKKSALIAGGVGFLVMSSVELYDGMSAKWGASWSDLVANAAGTILYTGQELLWEEQRIMPKFSFRRSKYADYRPDALGTNYVSSIIKDYNGETFWLSANIHSFIKRDFVPEWLCLSFGYGAEGMTGGMENVTEYGGRHIPEFTRFRQYYVSFDFDFTKIKTQNKALRLTLRTLNCIKLPFPALEYGNSRFRFHWLYF